MTQRTTRAFWMVGFAFVLLAPLVLRMLTPERNTIWGELTIVSGLLATSLLATVVVLTSRVKSITRSFGLEVLLSAHRYLGFAVIGTIALHLAFVIIGNPANLMLILPDAPLRAVFGLIGLIAVGILGGLTSPRFKGNRNHDTWRWIHIGLSGIVVGATATHIILLQHIVTDRLGGALLGALGGFLLTVLFVRWIVLPLSSREIYVVVRFEHETPRVTSLVLRPMIRKASFKFIAGQFAWIRLRRIPTGEHPFTIASATQDGKCVCFTFRHSGDWTRRQLMELTAGDRVWIDGPHGAMTLEERKTDRPIVMISGGVGLTPMMSMLRTLANNEDKRSIRLFLTDRPGETLFRHEISDLRYSLNLHVTETPPVRITAELLAPLLPEERRVCDYFICGSAILVSDALVSLQELGIPTKRIHTELFDLR